MVLATTGRGPQRFSKPLKAGVLLEDQAFGAAPARLAKQRRSQGARAIGDSSKSTTNSRTIDRTMTNSALIECERHSCGSAASLLGAVGGRGSVASRGRSTKTIKLAFIAIGSLLLILLVLTTKVESLNCYTCSSADDPGCDESFSGRANLTADATDCERHLEGKQAKVCRKIIQHIEHKKVVIRSCGWIDEHEERKPMCYKRSGTFALMMESCICYEDLCNHSASLVPNSSVLLLLVGLSSLCLLEKLSNRSW